MNFGMLIKKERHLVKIDIIIKLLKITGKEKILKT
jgi:hypothetical protein